MVGINRNLSPEQFSPTPSPQQIEPPHFDEAPGPRGPLPYGANTDNSAKQAAVWRKPGLLPLSSATDNSFFTPYGEPGS